METTRPRPTAQRIDTIQLLRALAATLVVLGHAKGAAFAHALLPSDTWLLAFSGGFGVDLFFAISGFIIVHAGLRMLQEEHASRAFILRRIARIAPLYWGVTALALAFTLAGNRPLPGWDEIAASLLFLPYRQASTQAFYPVFDLGWTLNYEMQFYLLFAFWMAMSKRRCVPLTVMSLIILVVAGFSPVSQNGPLSFWTQPIILEFGAGMLVAMAHRSGRLHFSVSLRIALWLLATALYLADPLGLGQIDVTPNGFVRVVAWGVPGLLMLIAAVATPLDLGTRWARAGVLLGNASFALYLLHPFALIFCEHALPYVPAPASARGWLLVLGGLAVAILISILGYRFVELPLTRWLTSRLAGGRSKATSSPPTVLPA